MSLSSLFLRRLRRQDPLPSALAAVRFMGGGPRTFAGGLNKWQYKRMHEKLAKEKERKLLQQERELYRARLRSEIRVKAASSWDRSLQKPDPSSSFTPISSTDHVKALADRFTKQGAEDLWNEDDGPISDPKGRPWLKPNSAVKPLESRGTVKNEMSSIGKLGSFQQRRGYARWRNLSSEDEDGELDGGDGGRLFRKEMKISRFMIGKEEEKEEKGFRGGRKEMMSGAALKNFDGKKENRRRKIYDEEDDLSEQIRGIREEFRDRESRGIVMRQCKEKDWSVLTLKR